LILKESTRVLVALALAIAGGVAIATAGSPTLVRAADFITPIGTLWVNAIRMTVIPLVVSLLVVGVASASDMKSIRLGRTKNQADRTRSMMIADEMNDLVFTTIVVTSFTVAFLHAAIPTPWLPCRRVGWL
jgi:L-cystine uptake protein TcyP (sodium:dicarboxylate symporter family)